jgi:hypothetical protein
MAHEIRMRDDGILWVALIGYYVDDVDIDAFIEELTPFLESATEMQPLLILSDTSRASKLSASARKHLASLGRDPRFRKTAILGTGRYIRVVAGFINKAAGRDNIRFFDSEQEAVDWLKAEC